MNNYDAIIIGAGPAGLTAGIYLSRNNLQPLIIDKETIGGKLADRELIENYPGYPDGISGSELAANMFEHATKYGAQFQFDTVEAVTSGNDCITVTTSQATYVAQAVIIAGGACNRKLGVPGEEQLIGRGVFYCATCEGPNYANKVVAVAGGGDSGLTEAMSLAEYAKKVLVFEALDRCSATGILQDRVRTNEKIEIHCGKKITAVLGEDRVTGLTISDTQTGDEENVMIDGLLVYIGLVPNTDYLFKTGILEKNGSITVGHRMTTPASGIFAAGDIREKSAMQISSAVGDGATAAMEAHKYIIECR